ncbi:hypothetical protein L0U85_08555 [Glycomyces sp. L485]|uniref:hypothetical protein n=1 Tax=Glycomyces sp. L485 TaxID=2909235 RepID=UPI001F4B6233|nr:hypothetical protein [Glycomyces sp. L485]MCH7230898.1 hypothetical protein [Glycomyces sp. L485]
MDEQQAPPGANAIGGDASGVLQNSGTFHGDFNVYMSKSDDPAELFETGLHRLRGNMPRSAEKLFSAAYDGGMRENRLWFFWALAILSGRSDIDLGAESFNELRACLQSFDRRAGDAFAESTLVVEGLLEISSLTREAASETISVEDVARVKEVLGRLRNLDPERRDDITRHLDRVIDGTVMDLYWQDLYQGAKQRRFDHGRVGRVAKFFITDPIEPGLRSIPHWTSPGAWPFASAGAGLASLVGLLLYFGSDAVSFWLVVAGAVGGLALIAWCAPALMLRRERIELRARHYRGVMADALWVRWPQVMEFRNQVAVALEHAFKESPPQDRTAAQWLLQTGEARHSLACRIAEQYFEQGNRQVTVDVEGVYWLAFHYADQFAEAATSGTLHHKEAGVAPAPAHAKPGLVGAGALMVSATVAATALSDGLEAAAAAFGGLAAAVAVAILGYNGLRLAMRSRFDAERRAWAEELLASEMVRYDSWRNWLSDRPSDWEMAEWLDADLSWLRMQAMNEIHLTHRDVLAHFAITEPDPDARAARVPGGPIRYSTYQLRIFLLTNNGVRIYGAKLDFEDGSQIAPSMDNFRYEMIISAMLVELGVRYGDNGATLVDRDQLRPNGNSTLAHAMDLRLHGRVIKIVIDNQRYRNLAAKTHEESKELLELAMETSGASEGLRILQSIAGEGKDWILTERSRQRRFFQRESFNGGNELESRERPALPGPRRPPDHPVSDH